MNKKNFLLLLSVAALILAVSFGSKILPFAKPAPSPTVKPTQEAVRLEVREENQTPFILLEKYAKEKSIPLQTKVYSFGTLVETIGNLTNSPEKAWIYFVNGKSGDVAADKKELRVGDVVEWKYLKPEF